MARDATVIGTIIYIVDEYPTITQTFVYREVEALRESGIDVRVFPLRRAAALDGRAPSYLLGPASRYPRARTALSIGFNNAPMLFKELARLLRHSTARQYSRQVYAAVLACALVGAFRDEALNPQFLHAHFLGRCTDVARFTSLISKLKYSATTHASDVYGQPADELFRQRIRSAAGIVGISQHVLNELATVAEMPATALVRCGIPFSRMPEVDRVDCQAISVISVGRLTQTKGLLTCVDAALILRDNGLQFEWTIIGEGPLRGSLEAAIEKHGLSDCVRLLGTQHPEETLRRVTTATCFVLPCEVAPNGDSDGIPVALMEAMALRVPVITSAVAGIPELVEHGVDGFLVPSRDPFATAQAVLDVVGSQETAGRLATNGWKRVWSSFNMDSEVIRLIQAFDQFHGPRVVT